MNQRQIEDAAGIDDAVAAHIMKGETVNARFAMDVLRLQVRSYDPGGFALIKASVEACKKEMGS